MEHDLFPKWLAYLDDQELCFVKQFVLSSGSLKEIANRYSLSYPTVRLRLDRIIQKISHYDSNRADSYISLIQNMALLGKIDAESAKQLIVAYHQDIQVEVLN